MSRGLNINLHFNKKTSFYYLFFLPHDFKFLCQLDLSLPLCFLCGTAQLLSVFVTEGVKSCSSVTNLSQLVLQSLIVHWQRQ